ncbi:hypothetical protein [Pectinatus frisingensis]|uniref:hypothetical protein n=1 Tax=Pectinatus frisingensis TaxID=865 RepID=UPI0018C4B645|nr:hypothetical protein [Pectinatus frisingensis]
MKKIWEKIKPWLIDLISCTAFFIVIYLVAWTFNGIKGTHFDLSNLSNFYLMIVGKQTAQHGIDSIFNSPKGQQPTK